MSWSASTAAMEAPRSWGWTRIDGRNVFAVPTGTSIRMYDSDDFILLHSIAPSGHRSSIHFVRWSTFHGKLASLSSTQIMVHAPQRSRRPARAVDRDKRVAYVPLCDLSIVGGSATWIRNLAFSRCTGQLLFSGHGSEGFAADSIGLLDVHAEVRMELSLRSGGRRDPHGPLLWSQRHEDCDVAKFSPNAFVFASLSAGARGPTVWRMKAASATATSESAASTLVVAGTETLEHGRADGDRVLYFSWKPARTPRHAVHETDGCRRPQWFEHARILLTCSAARTIRVWTEEDPRGPQDLPRFVPVLTFSPPHPIDNFRWVMSKNRNISDERFRVDDAGTGAADEWVSGVDRRGVLRLWRIRGLYGSASASTSDVRGVVPTVEETPFQLQVDDHVEDGNGNGDGNAGPRPSASGVVHGGFGEACVMAYFSQNYFGLPSKFDIVLERADHIMLSFDVDVDVDVDVVKERRRTGDGASALPALRRSLGAQPAARIRKKSWFRSHVGTIAALAAHPSLPLVASVDTPRRGSSTGGTEILIYWLSFSAFSAETRLIPSGVLPCDSYDGDDSVLCIQWIPTLHFDATPMLLVAFASGAVSVYGRSATAAGVVGSPSLTASSPFTAENNATTSTNNDKSRRRASLIKSPSMAPWTYYDYATGESGAEYEVSVVKRSEGDAVVRLAVSSDNHNRLVVAEAPEEQAPGDQSGEHQEVPADASGASAGDELVAVDGGSVMGKSAEEVRALLGAMPAGHVVTLRLRASNAPLASIPELELPARECDGKESSPRCISSVPFMDKYSSEHARKPVDEDARELQRGFLSSLHESLPGAARPHPSIVHAGSVSTYGGWMRLLKAEVASHLTLVCVCPAYADDGEYVPDVAVIFGLSSLPGSLLAWKGVRSKDARTFDLQPLAIERGFVNGKSDITAISGERDYRQRAFSSETKDKRTASVGEDGDDDSGLNSLLFVGGATGEVEHWRCRVSRGEIHFTLMSAFQVDAASGPSSCPSATTQTGSDSAFYRRGYVGTALQIGLKASGGQQTTAAKPEAGILHIEVDDPNRIAVVRADRPDEIDILEAESGLGILRLDESIREGKLRGRILGFCWCTSHVEFNVDALAVNYASGVVVYQFHTGLRRWAPIGDNIGGSLAIFDCTRDSSALLIGGGSQPAAKTRLPTTRRVHYEDESVQEDEEDAPAVSNEMPMVIGKWDEPGHLLQDSMDWKAPVLPQKLPVWHPYVVLTTLFGMHARVGEKDTSLAGDKVTYEFSRAFKDAVQMLKLLSRVVEDDASARRSARTGVLSFSAKRAWSANQTSADSSLNEVGGMNGGGRELLTGSGEDDSIGRYSTAIHKKPEVNKAEFFFAPPPESVRRPIQRRLSVIADAEVASAADLTTLSRAEMDTLHSALDVLLQGRAHAVKGNALRLFGSFETEHLVEMKAILSYVDAIQSLGFDLDASGADLGAKRYFAMHLFAKALKDALATYGVKASTSLNGSYNDLSHRSSANGSSNGSLNGSRASSESVETRINLDESDSWLREVPSSGVLWALHSDAQHFLLQRCCTDPKLTWQEHLRPMWLGLWVKDVQDLREVVERFAKQLYARSRDAMQVCLYYVALGKSNILGALAKMSRDDENKTLSAFLEHDFSQERWCNAAVKNAYSLLSKKRFEASAAFFLLCEPPRLQEAVRVLAVRLGDPSLALVVARLVEHRRSTQFQHDFMAVSSQRGVTPAGEVTKRLLRDDVVPMFRHHGDRWLESCALWWLEEFEQACSIISPPSQDVDVVVRQEDAAGGGDIDALLVSKTQAAARFYVNLTSVTIYFQYLHSNDNSSMLSWAKNVRRAMLKAADFESPLSFSQSGKTSPGRFRLASVTDIEHAFSFAAYVCKRNGLSDTALVEMLQARHLINTHARFEMSVLDASDAIEDALSVASGDAAPTSPRFRSSMRRLVAAKKPLRGGDGKNPLVSPRLGSSMRNLLVDRMSCATSDDWATSNSGTSGGGSSSPWSASPRRMSDINQSFSPTWRSPTSSPRGRRMIQRARTSSDWSELVSGSEPLDGRHRSSSAVAPWIKAQLADIECRRWASSAFVGKMIGLRVAREMISHFRADLDHLFIHFEKGSEAPGADQDCEGHNHAQSAGDRCSLGHRRYLEELCAPLCAQFQVDRAYVLEAALAVLQPHAHLHLAEVCFLLSQLRRRSALTKWIQYVALSVLRSCATFASCRVTDHVYRDWEGLTVQLCYLLHLDSAREIALPAEVVAQVTVAVRTGVLFLGWIRHRADIVHAAITRPFVVPPGNSAKLSAAAFAGHLPLLRKLESSVVGATGSDGRMNRERAYDSKVGFTFLGSVASYLADRDSAADDGEGDDDPSVFTEWGDVHNSATQHQFKVRKMYTLVLLVSILRTLYARARSFLDAVAASDTLTLVARHESDEEEDRNYAEQQELDIASSLFTPRKLWKDLGEGPLEGVKRWFTLTESHLRFEFDYSVREVLCVCGLYGLDGAAFDLTARTTTARRSTADHSSHDRLLVPASCHEEDNGTSGQPRRSGPAETNNWLNRIQTPRGSRDEDDGPEDENEDVVTGEDALIQHLEARGLTRDLHWSLVQTSDDYVLVLMKAGLAQSVRRFRADPRVYVDCFLLRDAFRWFAEFGIFADPIVDGHAFLARCCKQRKLRLLVAHRGQDTHLFPHSTPSPSSASPVMASHTTTSTPTGSSDAGGHLSHLEHDHEAMTQLPASFFLQAMMFVDPWEVEAVTSARRYLHGMTSPRHVELGRDRLSPLCDETCDDILASVFARDADLVAMWKESHGEGWLVTAITQFQLDGVRSIRRRPTVSIKRLSVGREEGGEGDDQDEEEPRIPFLVEIHSRAQRNAMFQETGLPHRFVGLITVSLLAARDLISCNWITEGSDPYVFFELLHAHEAPRAEPDGWSVTAYRSRVSPGKNPTWGAPDDQFVFRFAVPTHEQHVAGRFRRSSTNGSHRFSVTSAESTNATAAAEMWAAQVPEDCDEAVDALESLLPPLFRGPPTVLHCAVFHKNKVLAHQLMGRGEVELGDLTSGAPLDCWVPLDDGRSGAIHVRVALSFQLMCSSVAGANELQALR